MSSINKTTNEPLGYNKVKIYQYDYKRKVQEYLTDLDNKSKKANKVNLSPNRIKSAFFKKQELRIELRENSVKTRVKLKDDVEMLNIMFQQRRKTKFNNISTKKKDQSLHKDKVDINLVRVTSSKEVIKMKNIIKKAKDVLEYNSNVPKKTNFKKRCDFNTNCDFFKINHLIQTNENLKKKSLSYIKKEKLKSYIRSSGIVMPLVSAKSERDRYDEEMNKEINILLEEERKKEAVLKRKLTIVNNREVRRRNNDSKKLIKSHTLSTQKYLLGNTLRSNETQLNDIKEEEDGYLPSNNIEISLNKKNYRKRNFQLNNENNTINSGLSLDRRKTYNRLFKSSFKKMSFLMSDNRKYSKLKTLNIPKLSKFFQFNPLSSNSENSNPLFNTFTHETAISTEAPINTEIIPDKVKIDEYRKIEEDLLSVEVLENYRKINKQIEKERQKHVDFNYLSRDTIDKILSDKKAFLIEKLRRDYSKNLYSRNINRHKKQRNENDIKEKINIMNKTSNFGNFIPHKLLEIFKNLEEKDINSLYQKTMETKNYI